MIILRKGDFNPMGLREDSLKSDGNSAPNPKSRLKAARAVPATSRIRKKNGSKNFKQIFVLSFDALKERKARSALRRSECFCNQAIKLLSS
jgi:hypothetical protein